MTGINNEYAKAYTQVKCLLKYLPKEYSDKLPPKLIEIIEKNSNEEYNIDIDSSKSLLEHNFSKKTKELISVIKYNYWSTEEEKEILNKIFIENEKKFQSELSEKYSYDKLFNKPKKTIIADEAIVEYKESFFMKLKNWIKKIFNNKDKKKIPEANKCIVTFEDDENITIQGIKEKLGLFPKEIYDNDFMPQITNRGENYYSEGRIYDYNQIENIHTCKIKGSNIYDVSIMFNEENKDLIESMSCTCPHYMIHGQNCKHIYALLYKIKCEDDIWKIRKEISTYCDMITKIFVDTKHSIKNKRWKYSRNVILNYNEYSNYVERTIEKIKGNLERYSMDGILISNLFTLIREYRQVKKLSQDVLNNVNIYTGEKYHFEDEKNVEKLSLLSEINDILDMTLKNKEREKIENISGYTQEEIDAYALQDFEEDLVKQGLLNLDNFKDKY